MNFCAILPLLVALQGEPFSSFLYCLTTKPLIDEAKIAGGPDVKVIALTDDVNFLGPADGVAVKRAVQAYEVGCLRLNLRFQARKSAFIAFHGLPLSPELVTFAADKQMHIETRCYIIGGTPMGPDQERVQAEALNIAQKSSRFFKALQHDAMTAPVADRLLRLCGVPRVQFLARVGLLGEYEDALAFFDAQVQTAARVQAGLTDGDDIPAVSIQQAAPLRHAGFAFKAYSGNIALFASLGAFANAASHLHRLCPDGLPPRFSTSLTHTLTLVRERIDEETAARVLPMPSSNANECLHFFAVSEQGKHAAIKLQKTLSVAAAQKITVALLDTASPTVAARFFACTASYASAWLSDPFLARPMRDEAHGAACKLRLNQPISSLSTCYCGESLELDPWHILSHKGGGEAGRRHDEIVDRLVDAIQRAGGQAWSEPRQDFWQDRRRTDIYAVLGPKSYHIDVRVTHPTSLSYVETACQGPLRAAEAAAQEKRRRYAAMAHADGAEFVPFIVETFGGFGKDARTFIADLAKFAATTSQVWSAAETRFLVRAEVQRALFEGNLRVANAVLQESNPIRYASGRYHAVAPRPRRPPALEVDSDSEDCTFSTLVTETSMPSSTSVETRGCHGAFSPIAELSANTVGAPQTQDDSALSLLPPSGASTIGAPRGRNILALPSSSRASTSNAARGRDVFDLLPPSGVSTFGAAPGRDVPGLLPLLSASTSSAARGRDVPGLSMLPPLGASTSGAALGHDVPALSMPPLSGASTSGAGRHVSVLSLLPPSSVSTFGAPRGCDSTTSSPPIAPLLPYPPSGPSHPMQRPHNFLPPTSSQTTTTYRQSSNTADSLSSSNGTNTQFTSRTRRDVSAQTLRARASRNEAMSFLDTIHVSGRSQTSGINTQTQSRSERSAWRNDARNPPSSRGRTEPRSGAARFNHFEGRNGTHGHHGTERRIDSERRNGANREVRTTRHRTVRAGCRGTHRYR